MTNNKTEDIKCKYCGLDIPRTDHCIKYELHDQCFLPFHQNKKMERQRIENTPCTKCGNPVGIQGGYDGLCIDCKHAEWKNKRNSDLPDDEAKRLKDLRDFERRFVGWAGYFVDTGYLDVPLGWILKLSLSDVGIPNEPKDFDEIKKEYRIATYPTPEEQLKSNAVSWGYVYVMHAPIIDKYKIGFSNNPERRVTDISSSLPSEMKSDLLHKILTDDMPRLEKWFHEVLIEYRHDGEWFALNPVQLDEILSLERVIFQMPHHVSWLDYRENTLRTGEIELKVSGKIRRQLKLL